MASSDQILFEKTSSNRVHLFRLQVLIIDGSLPVLRNIFDQALTDQGITLSECLKQEKSTIDRLKGRVITPVQYDILFPACGKDPTTSDMDITLIICLLRNLKCFGLKTKTFNWNATPLPTDVTLEADLCRLKASRNNISHISTTTGMQPGEFTTWWNDIEQILVRLSSPALNIRKIIEDIKTCPLDPEEDKRIQEEIEKWKKYEADVDRLKEDMTEVKADIEELKRGQIAGNFSVQTEEEKYQNRKKKLQSDLNKFYRNKCSSIPLSPLFDEIETPLAGFYVMPDMVAVEQESYTSDKEIRTPIDSLKSLFSNESEDQQEIYLSADAGFGKTAFSKYLAITWCQAHRQDKNCKRFKDEELKALSDFDFLFLVLLRDCSTVCNIDEMIEQQITNRLPPSASVEEVLCREKCLIILDGLDEWTHPDNGCSDISEKIPHRYVRDNCVVLTTTRPWKLGVSNLKTSEITKKVELVQLTTESRRSLERNAISKMTGIHDDEILSSKILELNDVIRDRGLKHMRTIPLLLMYIICLWCNKIPVGNSKYEVYTNIIEFLLSRAAKKHPKVKSSSEAFASDRPVFFLNHEFCKTFYSLLTSLADLAYQTLFNVARENTLIFDRSVAENYLKADDMQFSLVSGILSESRARTLTKEISKVSFAHKTVHEFFAFIFISLQSDAQKIVLEKCKSVQGILNMSVIFEFISEMNADLMFAISNDLMSVINGDEVTHIYRTRTGVEYMSNNPLYNIQNMFISYLKEKPESENMQLSLQDVFISRNNDHNEQLQRLSKQNKTNIKSLQINTYNTSTSLRELVELFSLKDLSHIQKSYYYGRWKKKAEIRLLLFPSVQSVTLSWGEWTENDTENLGENFAQLQNLQCLHIQWFRLSHKILEIIFKSIQDKKSMKALTLNELFCKEHRRRECKGLNLDLSKQLNLNKLYLERLPTLLLNATAPTLINVELRGIILDENSLLLSPVMLNIERVKLWEIEMPAGCLNDFITELENLPQLVTVEMYDIIPETEYTCVREHIRSSKAFDVTADDHYMVFEFKTRKTSEE